MKSYKDRKFYWFNYQNFYDKIAQREDFKVFVELGVWQGHSISYLAKRLKHRASEVEIYGVDIFEDWNKNNNVNHIVPHIRGIFDKTLRDAGIENMVTPIKAISWEAAEKFEDESVDFVFIDADHEYASVCKDIDAWLPKIRKGGIISGHDYHQNPDHGGVRPAVNERFPNATVESKFIWWVEI